MVVARLKTPHGVGRYFEFLIDTGADYSMISKSDALTLGIDLKTLHGKEMSVELADLHVIRTQKIHLFMTLDDEELEIPILIADQNVECLLGRKGVFNHFDVLFQEKDQAVTFKKT